MRIYIGFDDTDVAGASRGTGKLARWFADKLPPGCTVWGILRQQFPRLPGIPYTSNNSSACVVVDVSDGAASAETLTDLAAAHIREHFIEGSDPGLCVVAADSPVLERLAALGRTCCERVVTQAEAMEAARGAHLSGHGGTNDGIIGSAAGVGLTDAGWVGRFVEFGGLRDFPDAVPVRDLETAGIRVISMDRDALVPAPDDVVETEGWLRPRLMASSPVLPVTALPHRRWKAMGIKHKDKHMPGAHGETATPGRPS